MFLNSYRRSAWEHANGSSKHSCRIVKSRHLLGIDVLLYTPHTSSSPFSRLAAQLSQQSPQPPPIGTIWRHGQKILTYSLPTAKWRFSITSGLLVDRRWEAKFDTQPDQQPLTGFPTNLRDISDSDLSQYWFSKNSEKQPYPQSLRPLWPSQRSRMRKRRL